MLVLDLLGPATDLAKLLVSIAALGGITRSLYSGYLRRAVRTIGTVDRLTERVGGIVTHQRLLVDAVIALAYAHQDDLEIDADRLHAELVDDDGPGRFLAETPEYGSDLLPEDGPQRNG